MAISVRNEEVVEFLVQSNLIENVGDEGFEDSLKAYNYAMGLKKIEPKFVLKIHKLLMRTLNPRIAGQFRTCEVMVGGRICPKPYKSQEMLEGFYQKVNDFKQGESQQEKDLYAKEVHVLFEHCHPFEDGNGRTGRILYAWHRIQMGLKLDIINYSERWEYYDWF